MPCIEIGNIGFCVIPFDVAIRMFVDPDVAA